MVEPLKNLEKFYQVRFEAAQAESELGARIIDELNHKLSDKQYCFFGFGHESNVKNNLILVAILTLLLFIPTFGSSQIAEQNMDVKLSSHLPLLNASTFLNIPTTDNSEQACHPSIIDFRNEYNKSAWHGYRYWMAYTPYTNGSNSVENPSLIASNNGIDWVVPTGISNPLMVLFHRYFSSSLFSLSIILYSSSGMSALDKYCSKKYQVFVCFVH